MAGPNQVMAFDGRRKAPLRLVFWAAAAFSFAMAINPHPPHFQGEPGDKIEHMAAFATLAALAAAAWPERRYATLGLGLSYFGAIIEIVQAIPALHRDCDIMDWVADTGAAIVVLTLVWIGRRLLRRS